jgi:hypothetical protein
MIIFQKKEYCEKILEVIIQRRDWGDGLETDASKDLEDFEPFSWKFGKRRQTSFVFSSMVFFLFLLLSVF